MANNWKWGMFFSSILNKFSTQIQMLFCENPSLNLSNFTGILLHLFLKNLPKPRIFYTNVTCDFCNKFHVYAITQSHIFIQLLSTRNAFWSGQVKKKLCCIIDTSSLLTDLSTFVVVSLSKSVLPGERPFQNPMHLFCQLYLGNQSIFFSRKSGM